MTKSTTSKELQLPSGATTKVRKLVGRDWLKISKDIPDVLRPAKAKPASTDQDREKNMAYGLALNETILTSCLGKITSSDGTSFIVVAKHMRDALPGEVTVEEFSDTEDGIAVVECVMELSGLTPAAAEAAKPFSEQPPVVGNTSCSGV